MTVREAVFLRALRKPLGELGAIVGLEHGETKWSEVLSFFEEPEAAVSV